MTDDTTALLRKEALKLGESMGLVDADLVALVDFSDCSFGTDGKPRGVVEAMTDFRRRKPSYFGLPSKPASEQTVEERIATLKMIRQRDIDRQARRNAAPVLAPGEKRTSAKDLDPATYKATLEAIRRRGN